MRDVFRTSIVKIWKFGKYRHQGPAAWLLLLILIPACTSGSSDVTDGDDDQSGDGDEIHVDADSDMEQDGDGHTGDGDVEIQSDGDIDDVDIIDKTDGDLSDGDSEPDADPEIMVDGDVEPDKDPEIITDGDSTDIDPEIEADIEKDIDKDPEPDGDPDTDGDVDPDLDTDFDPDLDIEEQCNGHGFIVDDICICDAGYSNTSESFLVCVPINGGDTDGDDDGFDKDTVLLDCCQPNLHSPGCLDQEIQACVCAEYDWCCTTRWTETCVNLVSFIPCGSCPEGDRDADEDDIEIGECGAVDTLSCGDSKLGDNFTGVSRFDSYPGCGYLFPYWEAPEVIYSLTSPADCEISVELTSPDGNLDYFVLDPCDINTCHGKGVDFGSNESHTFQSQADHEYQLVIDGRDGALSQFAIDITCDCEDLPDGDEEEESDLPQTCEIVPIHCGETLSGDTTGLQSTWKSYDGCGGDLTEWTGGELAYVFVRPGGADADEVTVELNATGGNLDLFLFDFLTSDCRISQCLGESTEAGGTESLIFSANAMADGFIIVDGRLGAGSPYTISVACENLTTDGDRDPDRDPDEEPPPDGDQEEDLLQCEYRSVSCGEIIQMEEGEAQSLWSNYTDEAMPNPCGYCQTADGDAEDEVDSEIEIGTEFDSESNCYEYAGPEWVYEFTAEDNCLLTVDLAASMDNLDLFILDESFECEQGICVNDSSGPNSLESLSIQVRQDQNYYIVVDSLEPPEGDFTLSLNCNCGGDGDVDLEPDIEIDLEPETEEEDLEPELEAHHCCQSGDAAGCGSSSIEACVCQEDTFCCAWTWDEICVIEAELLGCADCISTDGDWDPDTYLSRGDCCEANNTPGCNQLTIMDCVCRQNPSCCDKWTTACVDLVGTLGCHACPEPDGDLDEDVQSFSCCEAHAGPGCENFDIANCVCMNEPQCCSESWTLDCVAHVDNLVCGECNPIDGDMDADLDDFDIDEWDDDQDYTDGEFNFSCCYPHMSSGCEDEDIMNCVCAANSDCCNVEWTFICVFAVELLGCGDCSPPDGDQEPDIDEDDPVLPPFVCPGDAGNEIGVGMACTAGGGECPPGLTCLLDVGPNQPDICVLGDCTGDAQCGSGASCTPVADGSMCLPERCFSHVCVGDAGNDVGVGKACTDGGGECTGGTACAVESDYGLPKICTIFDCTSDQQCGLQASCHDNNGTVMCLPNYCIGMICEGDAGNEVGVGRACTTGGGECPEGTICVPDLDPNTGFTMCVITDCTDDEMCGSGASCQEGGICVPNRCLGAYCEGGEGNELGVGKTCSEGGGECTEANTTCALDVDPTAPSICIILNCAGNEACGTGAVCGEVETDFFVCLPEDCFGKKRGGYHETQTKIRSQKLDWTFTGRYHRPFNLPFLR